MCRSIPCGGIPGTRFVQARIASRLVVAEDYAPALARREREILEHAVHAVTEQAAEADT